MKRSKTSLFLIELMIALFLFGLCSAICLNIFAAANKRLKNAEDINNAVFLATSMAEIYKSGNREVMQEQFPNGRWTEDRFTAHYDENWNPVDNFNTTSQKTTSNFYTVTIEEVDNIANIYVIKDINLSSLQEYPVTEDTIFNISVKAVK